VLSTGPEKKNKKKKAASHKLQAASLTRPEG